MKGNYGPVGLAGLDGIPGRDGEKGDRGFPGNISISILANIFLQKSILKLHNTKKICHCLGPLGPKGEPGSVSEKGMIKSYSI